MNARTLGVLVGLPVETVDSYDHPDLPPAQMHCGMPRTWIRWGGGPWWVYEGMPGRRARFYVEEWLAAGPWPVEDAIDLWSRWGYPPLSEADAELNHQESLAARTDWDAAHARYLVRQRAAARAYAVGLGVL